MAIGSREAQRGVTLGIFLLALTLVFGFGMVITYVMRSPAAPQRVTVSENFSCTVDSITDGDTFRCSEADQDGRQIRVRLSGVAARETDGSCSPGHPCPDASAEDATAELTRLTEGQVLSCRQVGTTYGRAAAFCKRQDGIDLSCAMVESGTVLKWRKYWGWHRC